MQLVSVCLLRVPWLAQHSFCRGGSGSDGHECIYLPACLSVCLSVYLPICLSVYLSGCLPDAFCVPRPRRLLRPPPDTFCVFPPDAFCCCVPTTTLAPRPATNLASRPAAPLAPRPTAPEAAPPHLFKASKITSNLTKFNHAVSHLPPEVLLQVSAVIAAAATADKPYKELKTALKSLQSSVATCLNELLNSCTA
ncbi:hypothetical protein E2C01_072275 [Portunus trituberculatus]|uniref:DUF7041 domain-containing protein n=1 Tax=Portunus trituberculatus TaxID=210409 RepID=A0A5B7IAA8_PORTR|nr:hypothetical protein [Portunus trituberculatus]